MLSKSVIKITEKGHHHFQPSHSTENFLLIAHFQIIINSYAITCNQPTHTHHHHLHSYSKLNMVSICNTSLVLCFLLFLGANIATSEARVPRNQAFVRARGSHFVLHGSPFLFNGFNAYWMMNVASDPNQRDKVSEVFRESSAAGLTVCRTWAFSDGGDRALQISPGTYDERVFQVKHLMTTFDHIVTVAS